MNAPRNRHSEFKERDQAYGVTNPRFIGAYAEYTLASAAMVSRKPTSLTYIEAASVPVIAVTAWQALFDQAQLQAGQTVVIHGATAAVVFVEYSRSPEARYPIAIEECYATIRYIADNGQRFNLDATRLAVAGGSSGANIATVVSMLAKQRQGPYISFQLLMCPTTDASFDSASFHEFESVEQLRGLPPALVVTAEMDVLRDQGEAYARKLLAAGIPMVAVRYLGVTHVFMLLNPLASIPAARGAIALATDCLKETFER